MWDEREALLSLSIDLVDVGNHRYTISYGAIGVIFLISGMSIPTRALIDNATKFRLHFIVQVISYLVLSHGWGAC